MRCFYCKEIIKKNQLYDEFEDMISNFIHDNVYPAGDELDFSKKWKENLKELYEKMQNG